MDIVAIQHISLTDQGRQAGREEKQNKTNQRMKGKRCISGVRLMIAGSSWTRKSGRNLAFKSEYKKRKAIICNSRAHSARHRSSYRTKKKTRNFNSSSRIQVPMDEKKPCTVPDTTRLEREGLGGIIDSRIDAAPKFIYMLTRKESAGGREGLLMLELQRASVFTNPPCVCTCIRQRLLFRSANLSPQRPPPLPPLLHTAQPLAHHQGYNPLTQLTRLARPVQKQTTIIF